MIFSSCAPFKVYPTPLQVIAPRAREGGPKERRRKQKLPRETHLVTYEPVLSTLSRSLHGHYSIAQGHLHTIQPA